MSCIIDMVIVMASATVLINVYAPGMTHAPNNTSAYVTYLGTTQAFSVLMRKNITMLYCISAL